MEDLKALLSSKLQGYGVGWVGGGGGGYNNQQQPAATTSLTTRGCRAQPREDEDALLMRAKGKLPLLAPAPVTIVKARKSPPTQALCIDDALVSCQLSWPTPSVFFGSSSY